MDEPCASQHGFAAPRDALLSKTDIRTFARCVRRFPWCIRCFPRGVAATSVAPTWKKWNTRWRSHTGRKRAGFVRRVNGEDLAWPKSYADRTGAVTGWNWRTWFHVLSIM